MKKYFIENIKQ